MGVRHDLRMGSVARYDFLIEADGNQRWPDEVKDHLVT